MSSNLHQRLQALRSLEQRIRPDEAWVAKTRETLCMQVRNSVSQTPEAPGRVLSRWVRTYFPHNIIRQTTRPVLAMASTALFLLGSSVASVSAAEHSLPGDFLYNLKLVTEQARLVLTPAKEERLKLKIEFTTRRVQELKSVAGGDKATNSGRVAQAAEILKRDLSTVRQQLDDVKKTSRPEQVVEVAKLVDQTTTLAVQSLQESKTSVTPEVQAKVVEAQVAASDTGIKAIEVLVERNAESNHDVSDKDVVHAIEEHAKTVANVTQTTLIVTSTPSFVAASGTTVALPLPEAFEQMKLTTQNAFAAQKAADELMNSGEQQATSSEEVLTSETSTTVVASSTRDAP